MVEICTVSFLSDLDCRIEASGNLDPTAVRIAQRRTAYEGFRVRFNFILQQLFLDWNLWSKVSPVAALQHVRSLLKKAKEHRTMYRAQLSVARLLTAAGFYFACVSTMVPHNWTQASHIVVHACLFEAQRGRHFVLEG